MNNNDKPTIRYFDDFPFTNSDCTRLENIVVCGQSGTGETGPLQSIVGEYSADAVRQGISIASEYSADAVRQGISIAPTPPSEDEAKS